jgi:hypothetical protein
MWKLRSNMTSIHLPKRLWGERVDERECERSKPSARMAHEELLLRTVLALPKA